MHIFISRMSNKAWALRLLIGFKFLLLSDRNYTVLPESRKRGHFRIAAVLV